VGSYPDEFIPFQCGTHPPLFDQVCMQKVHFFSETDVIHDFNYVRLTVPLEGPMCYNHKLVVLLQ